MNEQVILSCIDGSSQSEAVCGYSAWIAKAVDAPLKLLHTIERSVAPEVSDLTGAIGLGSSEELLTELTNTGQSHRKLLIKKGKLMLEAAAAKAAQSGLQRIEVAQLHGSLCENLIDLEDDIRVLVLGIHGENNDSHEAQAKIGAQLENVIRSLHKPILVVNKRFNLPKKIMLAYDGSDAANKALQMVASSPLFKDIPCHLVHLAKEANNNDPLLDRAAKVLTDGGIDVIKASLSGHLEDVIVKYQVENDIDLTLMGAFGHNRVRHLLLGSFTAKMLQLTQKPLLLLR